MDIKELIKVDVKGQYQYYAHPNGTIYYHDGKDFVVKKVTFKKNVPSIWVSDNSRAAAHRIIAKAFVSNPDNKPFVMFKDNDKSNLRASNLMWVTLQEKTKKIKEDGLVSKKELFVFSDYTISKEGVVIAPNGDVLKTRISNRGYVLVNICQKTYSLHRLVAKKHIPNPENKKTVNHKDLDKTNNNDWNLEWATGSENNIHAIHNEAKVQKLTPSDAMEIFHAKGKHQIIAKKYGVARSTIVGIKSGYTWWHINGIKKHK